MWLTQTTDYPWLGNVRVRLDPERAEYFVLQVRIPGWAREEPVPSDLYRYADKAGMSCRLSINGQEVAVTLNNGYAVLAREWQPGDIEAVS